jgi:RNA polymerase sigma-70 factor (ECF subfamily)
MNPTDLSDQALVTKAREGDKSAFDALVLRYRAQAILVAQSVLRNFELAKEASQDAFVKAYFGLKHFREEANFKTWLFKIVINEARDVYRKEKARGLFKFQNTRETEEGEESILEVIPSGSASPREVFEMQETKKQLERAIYRLPERERDVFILRYLNGLALSEVAETLGMAVGTVKAHLAHGTHRLRTLLLAPAPFMNQAGR